MPAPNPYERGRRDGTRGLPRASTYADQIAHDEWQKHRAYHGVILNEECALECQGIEEIPEERRKTARQVADGLSRLRHTCPECGAILRTRSLAQERHQYDAGYEAGLAQYARDQQRRRSDQQRKSRRQRRRG